MTGFKFWMNQRATPSPWFPDRILGNEAKKKDAFFIWEWSIRWFFFAKRKCVQKREKRQWEFLRIETRRGERFIWLATNERIARLEIAFCAYLDVNMRKMMDINYCSIYDERMEQGFVPELLIFSWFFPLECKTGGICWFRPLEKLGGVAQAQKNKKVK